MALDRFGAPLPDEVIESIRRNSIALKGPVATPVGGGFESVNVRLRRTLDLYANLRPVRNLPGVPSRFGDVDLIIVRENTEGLYSGQEHVVVLLEDHAQGPIPSGWTLDDAPLIFAQYAPQIVLIPDPLEGV